MISLANLRVSSTRAFIPKGHPLHKKSISSLTCQNLRWSSSSCSGQHWEFFSNLSIGQDLVFSPLRHQALLLFTTALHSPLIHCLQALNKFVFWTSSLLCAFWNHEILLFVRTLLLSVLGFVLQWLWNLLGFSKELAIGDFLFWEFKSLDWIYMDLVNLQMLLGFGIGI